jgi:TetR/AcrR family transcriptional regulator, transcriptional repressor for nem operon
LSDQSTQSESTRDRIIEAARDLFSRQGYAATGISQILRASRARSGSLYHFFPSKEDLLVAVLEKHRTTLEPKVLRQPGGPRPDPVERLFGILDTYRGVLIQTQFTLGCPVGGLALEVSNTYPAVRRSIVQHFETWSTAINRLLTDAAGHLPADVDTIALARHVLATLQGAVMLARAYRSVEPFDQAVQQLRDYFERLIADGSEWSGRAPSSAL